MKTKQLATQLLGSYEIELHYKRPLYKDMFFIGGVPEATTCFKSFIHPKRIDLKEFFLVMLLTNANRVIGISEVASGSTIGVMTNIKEIFQLALITNASAIIICHNHPSGKLNISAGDKKETAKLQTLAKLLDITLLDHIVVTSESSVSFIQEGLL